MRIDPLDVFANTLFGFPLKLLMAWLVSALGSFIPIALSSNMPLLDAFFWQCMFLPFYLFLTAGMSGLWTAFAFLSILAWGIWFALFILRERPLSDLFPIATLAYFITIDNADRHLMSAVAIGFVMIAVCVFLPKLIQWRMENAEDQSEEIPLKEPEA